MFEDAIRLVNPGIDRVHFATLQSVLGWVDEPASVDAFQMPIGNGVAKRVAARSSDAVRVPDRLRGGMAACRRHAPFRIFGDWVAVAADQMKVPVPERQIGLQTFRRNGGFDPDPRIGQIAGLRPVEEIENAAIAFARHEFVDIGIEYASGARQQSLPGMLERPGLTEIVAGP